jgi:hypothetical protein
MYRITVTVDVHKGLMSRDHKETGWIMENEGHKTISVPQAGKRYFDLGKNASYEAARRGDLPIIRIGGRLRVPVVALERMLANAGANADQRRLE